MLQTKRTHQSTSLQTFESCNKSLRNSSCHVPNCKVRVYSNFESLFSIRKDNSSLFFQLKPFILWKKIAHQFEIFKLLSCQEKNHQIPHVIFETTSQFFFKLKIYMIWTKGAHQSAKFHTFDCSREISPNLYLGRLLFLKLHKISAKIVERNCVS